MPELDVGYVTEPFTSLCRGYPGEAAYPAERFRLEWARFFHRGRLDGTACPRHRPGSGAASEPNRFTALQRTAANGSRECVSKSRKGPRC
jgi:hypothetical protein